MKIKDSTVNIWGLNREMLPVLKYSESIWKEQGQEVVVTSARDGMHSAASKHYVGDAVDLRNNYFSAATCKVVCKELSLALGVDYDIVLEGNHIHVEYDKKS